MIEPGAMLGPYRLVTRLGAGAMGEVWRAMDTRLDRAVALKLLPPRFAQDPDRRARMLREAKAAAGVPHANVVALFDIDEAEGQDYLVMELVEGRTIAELLQRGPLPLPQALDVAAGVADALAAAHQKGILHRDIKAANVMVTPAGVKVLDFGLAKLRGGEEAPSMSGPLEPVEAALDATVDASSPSAKPDTQTQAGTLLGTPAYFSPEQVAGQSPDERSEIFAVGVLLYEMIAGRNPFSGRSMRELFAAITRCEPEPLDAPEAVRAVVSKALAPDAPNRHPSMAALATELRETKQALFGGRRGRILWIAGSVLVAAAVAGIIGFVVARPATRSPADQYLDQALREYDVYFNDKAQTSLNTAMRVAPGDPRPYAYKVLFGQASGQDRIAAADTALAKLRPDAPVRERALVQAAAALVTRGPAAAREAMGDVGGDLELGFWRAELAWQAGDFDDAAAGYAQLLDDDIARFRGRIFDYYSACLLYRDRIAEAVTIGERYAKEYPGEADAIGTQATVYAAAGRLDEALRLAEDARALNESEDTVAGLAKVHALRGELDESAGLYARAIELAPAPRRPLRRAGRAWVLALAGHPDDARAAWQPCLGEEREARTVTICLAVAGLVEPEHGAELGRRLRALAEVTPPDVPYGRPEALARIVERGGLDDAGDLFASYHLPFFASVVPRLRAASLSEKGDVAGAIALLQATVAARPAEIPAWLDLAEACDAAGRAADAADARHQVQERWKSADRDQPLLRRAVDAAPHPR